jgi:hypothetical protein
MLLFVAILIRMTDIVSWLGNSSYGVAGQRLAAPQPGGFNPVDISGLRLWLDANDSSTINANEFGTIRSWTNKGDISGNFDLSGTADVRYGEDFVNGLNAVVFNADAFMTGTFAFNFQQRSLFIVSKRNTIIDSSGGIGFFTWLTGDTSGQLESGILYDVSNSTFGYLISKHPGFAVELAFDTQTDTTGQAELVTFVNSATDLSANYVSLNSQQQNLSFSALASGYATSNLNCFLGNYFSGTTLANDYTLCEVIMYDTALDATNIALVEGYLMTKWAITAPPTPVPPAPVFSPTDISGLQVWFDSTDSVVLDLSGNVGSWSNKGSSSGLALPNYGTTSLITDIDLNNQQVVAFSNADMIWNTTLNYQDRTQFVVSKVTSDMSGAAYPYCAFINNFTYDSNAGGVQTGVSWDSNTNLFQYTMCQNSFNCPIVYDTSANPINIPFLAVFVNDSVDLSNNAFYLNNSSNLNVGSNLGNLFWTSNADYYLNNANGGSNGQNQHLAEIIEYDSVLSSSNIAQVTSYLSDKWGLNL